MSNGAARTAQADHHPALIPLLLIASLVGLVIIVYASSFATMAELWQHSDHHHGVLVFPIVAYLLWRSRGHLAHVPIRPWAGGVAIMALLAALWVIAQAIGVQAAEHLLAVLMIPAAVAALLGVRLTRRALFPLLFLIAAVPIGDTLVPALMRITADLSAALLRVSGVPVFREGQFMSLPGGNFEVADVCSGLRYLTSGVILSLLFAYLTYSNVWKRALFVAITVVTVVIANAVRAYLVMLIASATELQYLGGRDHIYFGWLLFAVVIIALFWVGSRYADASELVPRAADSAETKRARAHLWPLILVLAFAMLAVTSRPLREDLGWVLVLPAIGLLLWVLYRNIGGLAVAGGGDDEARVDRLAGYRSPAGLALVLATGAALLAGPLLSPRTGDAGDAGFAELRLPAVPGCEAPGAWSMDWQPAMVAPHYTGSAAYECAGTVVNAFVAGYGSNREGSELISTRNQIVPGAFRRAGVSTRTFTAGDGEAIEVAEMLVRGAASDLIIWHWYGVGEHTAIRPAAVKMLQAYQQIVHRSAGGELYVLAAEVEPTAEADRSRLEAVARRLSEAAPYSSARLHHRNVGH